MSDHPEYRAGIENGTLPEEVTDEDGNVMSPRAHLTLHAVVERQIAGDTPAGITRIAQNLERCGASRHEIRHVIGAPLAEQMWYMMKEGCPFDERRYDISVAPGRCAAALDLTPQHLQHLGRVHGGVITTVAGHAALGAAMSIAADGGPLVLPSFSMNLLRSAESGRLLAEATVVKGGATLVFVETDVFNTDQGSRTLIAKAAFTFARAPAAR